MSEYTSQEVGELAKALINVQRQLQPATKDANNPFTKSKYATLNSVMDSCREALLSNGIWLCQYPVPADPGYLGLVTKLTHAESGQWQSSLAVVPLPTADPQGVGISMTYMRRYALSAMLGIVTEEDTDGELASDKPNRPQRQKNAVTAPQRGKTTQDDSGTSKKDFPRLKSSGRRTFKIAPSGWSFIPNRTGTGRSGVHPRHRKHGGEKGTAFGGGVSLEPPTKNLVEVCRIAERAVLDGAALSILALITGGNEWTERTEIRERKGCLESSAADWNAVPNSAQPFSLATAPNMSGYRISPKCWTAHGRHWLPSSSHLIQEH